MMPINHINNIAVIGCAGAIGRTVTEHLSALFPKATIHGFCRSQSLANLLACQSVTQSASNLPIKTAMSFIKLLTIVMKRLLRRPKAA